MKNKREETSQFVRDIVGAAPNSAGRDSKGMDEIDKWAERLGKADRGLHSMTPKRRFRASIT